MLELMELRILIDHQPVLDRDIVDSVGRDAIIIEAFDELNTVGKKRGPTKGF